MSTDWDNLADAIEDAIRSRLSIIHTCLPAQVEEYDHETAKASVKPLLKRKYVDDEEAEYPVIANVPVVWPRTSKAIMHFPLERGDGVLLVFSERSLDTWLSDDMGNLQPPSTRRKFDLSDAIAIPGLWPFTSTTPLSGNVAMLQYGDATIEIKDDGQVSVNDGNLTVDL